MADQKDVSHVDTMSEGTNSRTGGKDAAGSNDGLGLHVDMLDADRLREWARLLLVFGPDISHWGSVPFVASKMQTLATDLEKTVRDIGVLRDDRRALLAACKKVVEHYGDPAGGQLFGLRAAIAKAEGQ